MGVGIIGASVLANFLVGAADSAYGYQAYLNAAEGKARGMLGNTLYCHMLHVLANTTTDQVIMAGSDRFLQKTWGLVTENTAFTFTITRDPATDECWAKIWVFQDGTWNDVSPHCPISCDIAYKHAQEQTESPH